MKKSLICLTLALALAPAISWARTTFDGKVINVLDGDTIDVLTKQYEQVRIRLAWIDAPEKSQAFGTVSKQSLSDMVYGKNVTVVFLEKDFRERSVGQILIDNTDVNFEQVKKGYAWHYKRYTKTQTASEKQTYSLAENNARFHKVGLWADKSPFPPWNFRREKRESSNSGKY